MRCGTTKGAARIGAVSGGSPQIASDRPNPWIDIGVSTAAGACGLRRRLRTGLEWVVGNQFSQLGVRRAGRCSRRRTALGSTGPVDLVHHDGCVEDGSPTVLPRQRLAFLLSSVLLSLKKVVDLAPVGKQSVEQVASASPSWPPCRAITAIDPMYGGRKRVHGLRNHFLAQLHDGRVEAVQGT